MDKDEEIKDLKQALADIGRFMKYGRKNLATNAPEEIVDRYLPDSTLELQEIVKSTEHASNTIMDACDAIEAAVAGIDDEAKQKVLTETAKIFAECGFQDITGQRVGKVTSYLQHVEQKSMILVKHLKDFFDKDGNIAEEFAHLDEEMEEWDEEHLLLNGPQLEGQGLSQAEVDAMLNDF